MWMKRPGVIASLTSCCLLHNPLGEGVNEIIKVFEQTPRLRTLCGFEEGIEKILQQIDYWREAPVWTPDSIADATKDWFKYLGK